MIGNIKEISKALGSLQVKHLEFVRIQIPFLSLKINSSVRSMQNSEEIPCLLKHYPISLRMKIWNHWMSLRLVAIFKSLKSAKTTHSVK